MTNGPPPSTSAGRRRHAAGADPDKRDRILDGAAEVFFERGFDGASMNDICRAAGVSKGTLYVYFADKVDLFSAIVARERDRHFAGMRVILDGEAPIGEKLAGFARHLVAILCSERVLKAQRIVLGAVEKMPELGARFFTGGATQTQGQLRAFLEREVAAGRLRIEDPELASAQFVELATAGLWRPRLFGKIREAPDPAELDRVVSSAVHLFLARYGTGEDRASV
ncbi:TetR/AcrR family transcriptional regulator C-terminal domain-containing protein [Celeribacter indicus]|uniref:TetR family transcriptional regulator n=1 Tax=Celeribacter indicus TaxID=1208324 RepID=A0A0B5DWC0_9RHOB|nr:TetR/AcrR family transcriptional regulator C-terminal domain-containing protein [Celeribacter indicus]AJE45445.1 TetR family transcriptional regulator [Celeribacter indicus]SDX02167.1 transcriptional regulator, TetR family [Celeribacter indicus]